MVVRLKEKTKSLLELISLSDQVLMQGVHNILELETVGDTFIVRDS